MRFFVISLLIFTQMFSQQVRRETGTLTGLVVDAETNQPIFGVNVIILNTFLGSATNHEGKFTIKNIPAWKI
jgi:hypothetical protein